MAATDKALVMKAQRGDREAFGRLVSLHHARLIGAARAIVRDDDAAEDISQEAFVEAYSSLPKLKRPESFPAWLFGIMRHRALNHLRSAEREVAVPQVEAQQPEPASAPPDAAVELRERLDQLPERDREVLAAKYLQDLSYQKIAEMLGITVNTVRVRCCRAKQRLRELIGQTAAGTSRMAEEGTP